MVFRRLIFFIFPVLGMCVDVVVDKSTYTITTDGLVWTRSDPSQQLLAYDQTTAERVFQTSDLNFAAEIGYQIEASYRINPSLLIRGIYARGHWDKLNAKIETDPNIFSSFFLSRVTQTEANMRSKLADADLGLSLDIFESIFLLVGPRYFYFRESLDLNQAFPNSGSVLDYAISAKNNLIGLQLGMELSAIFKQRLDIGMGIKVGGSLNLAQQKSRATLTGFFVDSESEKNKRSGAGFLEIYVSAKFQMAPWMFLKIGYDALILSGLATASDNLSQTLLQNNLIQEMGLIDINLNTQSQIIFTKGLVGLEFKW